MFVSQNFHVANGRANADSLSNGYAHSNVKVLANKHQVS